MAREKDACGPEVYDRASRYFLGTAVDLPQAYAWSWAEIALLRAEQARVAATLPSPTDHGGIAMVEFIIFPRLAIVRPANAVHDRQ